MKISEVDTPPPAPPFIGALYLKLTWQTSSSVQRRCEIRRTNTMPVQALRVFEGGARTIGAQQIACAGGLDFGGGGMITFIIIIFH